MPKCNFSVKNYGSEGVCNKRQITWPTGHAQLYPSFFKLASSFFTEFPLFLIYILYNIWWLLLAFKCFFEGLFVIVTAIKGYIKSLVFDFGVCIHITVLKGKRIPFIYKHINMLNVSFLQENSKQTNIERRDDQKIWIANSIIGMLGIIFNSSVLFIFFKERTKLVTSVNAMIM